MKSLAQLRHRGHEVLVFQIWDRDELDFPFKQWTRFINLEDEADMHMIDPATLRRAYLKIWRTTATNSKPPASATASTSFHSSPTKPTRRR
ncbi:MAG: hypothetical protein R3F11_06125 [Verrucomicrobiales bacterium]